VQGYEREVIGFIVMPFKRKVRHDARSGSSVTTGWWQEQRIDQVLGFQIFFFSIDRVRCITSDATATHVDNCAESPMS